MSTNFSYLLSLEFQVQTEMFALRISATSFGIDLVHLENPNRISTIATYNFEDPSDYVTESIMEYLADFESLALMMDEMEILDTAKLVEKLFEVAQLFFSNLSSSS